MDIYNDNFIEYLIKKKRGAKEYAVAALLIFGGVVVSLAMLLLVFYLMANRMDGGLGSGLGLVVIALAWYAVYLLMAMQNVEFEYILTNSEMDIDKVMSKRGRKHLVEWDFKNIEICAAVEDKNHAHEYAKQRDKVYDLTGDKKLGSVYFVDYTGDNGAKIRVLFQPTSKMIDTAAKYNRNQIFIME